MINLSHVNMEFRGKQILHNINLAVEQGETMVIIGPSGSGKSTILRLIIGLLKPTMGEIFIKGQDISRFSEEHLNKIRMDMGMVFQYSALFDSMTVGENVAFGLREHTDMEEKEISKIVSRNLRMVGLADQQDRMPNELSGGMKKRVSLARAIAMKPQIMLYDEPTAGLDPIMSGTIDRLIMNTKRMLGVTSIVVTHHMSSAFTVADRIAMIHDGSIIEIGTVEEIKQSENPLVQQFIHGLKTPGAYVRRRSKLV